MTKTFTEHDLIRYLYHETSEKEEKEINTALLCDSELLGLYNELSAVKRNMDNSLQEPSAECVHNILSYARSLSAKEPK